MIHRLILLIGIALALAVRVAVPVGWMPAPSADGGFLLMPCGAAAEAQQPMVHGSGHSDHHEQEDSGSSEGAQDCAFAPLQTGLFWLGAGGALLSELAAYTQSLPATKPRRITLAWPAAPPPSTGPPVR